MQEQSKRLVKNTLVLTLRMLFLLFINLYASRVLLKSLGIDNFGIYSVVGGFVLLFSVVSNSLSAAISRFITVELGKNNREKLKKIFATSVIVQIVLALVILLLLESIGLWYLNTHINMSDGRLSAANWAFQFSILTFVINLISLPYNALIIAHERMSAFAYISIYEGIAKLLITISICLSPIDYLIYYAACICALSLSVRFIYTIYCKRHFEECLVEWKMDRSLIKEIFGFAGWNFIGATSGLLRDQGGNLILNLFFGTGANAARSIAYQVENAVNSFVSGFSTAMSPQITKSYSNGDNSYFMMLLFKGARVTYYVLWFFSLPILLCTPYILQLWLGVVIDYTVTFTRLAILLTLSESISRPLVTAMLATGNIKKYQIIVGGLNLLNLPVSYLMFKLGMPAESVFIVALVLSQVCLFARLFLLKDMIHINSLQFFSKVYLNIISVSLTSALIPVICLKLIGLNSIWDFVILCMVCAISSLTSIWIIGCDIQDKAILLKHFLSFIKRLLS